MQHMIFIADFIAC